MYMAAPHLSIEKSESHNLKTLISPSNLTLVMV